MKRVTPLVYIYPAIFTPEKDGGFSIYFPDLPGTNSQGNNMADAMRMARESLASWLDYLMDERLPIPKATIPFTVPLETGQIVTLIDVDMVSYRRRKNSKAVNKTVTLPSWLNEEAEAAKLNFSGILQEGLKNRLQIEDR
jgi:predicted RNase H-like HicB family nuclease